MTIHTTCGFCLAPYPFPLNVHHNQNECISKLIAYAGENVLLQERIARMQAAWSALSQVRENNDEDYIAKVNNLISYWNRKWDDPRTQIRADAFIEAFEVALEMFDGGTVEPFVTNDQSLASHLADGDGDYDDEFDTLEILVIEEIIEVVLVG